MTGGTHPPHTGSGGHPLHEVAVESATASLPWKGGLRQLIAVPVPKAFVRLDCPYRNLYQFVLY